MKKILLLYIISILVLGNSAVSNANNVIVETFACKNWEDSLTGSDAKGTLMVGEAISEKIEEKIVTKFNIKNADGEKRTLNYIGKYNFNLKLYSSEVPESDIVEIYAIAELFSILTNGYDLLITKIEYLGENNTSTYCNYQY
jgi:hypothetical protein